MMVAFPRLRLPRELRDLVYYFSLTNYHDAPRHRLNAMAVYDDRDDSERNVIPDTLTIASDSHIFSSLGLLRTCYQIYLEAYPYFYSHNTFCLFVGSVPCPLYTSISTYSPDIIKRFRPITKNKTTSLRISDFGDGRLDPQTIFQMMVILQVDSVTGSQEVDQHLYDKLEIELSLPIYDLNKFDFLHNLVRMAKETKLSVKEGEGVDSKLRCFERSLIEAVESYHGFWGSWDKIFPSVELVNLGEPRIEGGKRTASWIIKPGVEGKCSRRAESTIAETDEWATSKNPDEGAICLDPNKWAASRDGNEWAASTDSDEWVTSTYPDEW